MRTTKKLLSVVIAIIVLETVTGCSLTGRNAGSAYHGNLKPVELRLYMVGDAPKDLQEINDKINVLAKKDLNCTVQFNYTSWIDFPEKYNILLSSGQPVDLLYTATWLNYSKLAKNGAFKALDDLLPMYAPNLQKFVSDSYWNQVKVDGKIYTIPSTWHEYATDGFQYRKDLQEKYKLPEPNSLENVERYFEGIKKNLPDQLLTMEYTKSGPEPWSFSAFEILSMKYKWVAFGTPYGLVADYDDPSDIRIYWGTAEFIEDMKMFKRWADKGFWPKSALSTKADVNVFDTGKIVAMIQGQNPNKYAQSMLKLKTSNLKAEVGYIPYPAVNGVATFAHATQNGFSIPDSSKNTERALMFYEKLVLDKTYNQLTQYGIEGKHYTVQDGYYKAVGDATKSGFPREGMNGWAWRNTNFMLFDQSFDVVKNMFDDLDKIAESTKFKGVNIFDGFYEDDSSYQGERSALGAVMTQYLEPLEAGLVPNVEAATDLFMLKAKAAGLEKIQAEYIRQWKDYCEKYKYR
jgi:putative aldouronate transport system substrate-binding protein